MMLLGLLSTSSAYSAGAITLTIEKNDTYASVCSRNCDSVESCFKLAKRFDLNAGQKKVCSSVWALKQTAKHCLIGFIVDNKGWWLIYSAWIRVEISISSCLFGWLSRQPIAIFLAVFWQALRTTKSG